MNRSQKLAKARADARRSRSPRTAAGPLHGKKMIGILCIALAGLTMAVYSPVLGNQFVIWDDQSYVTGNQHVVAGLTWETIAWAFASTSSSNWHPLTWLSHAFDCQFFGLDAAAHHLHNVLLHALDAVLLFLLLYWGTKHVAPSLFVAALFATHPLNVESVAWVAERKNVLSTLYFFLAIMAYGWYARRPDWLRYLLVAALFAAGLMAKPMVITLPFVLLLLDYWPLGRMDKSADTSAAGLRAAQLALEKAPLLLLSAVSAWITIKAQSGVVRTLEEFSFPVRAENSVVAYGLYLWKMVWPAHLAAFYPHPANALPVWQVTLSAFVLVAVTVLVVILRRHRYLPVGWFWFLGTLVPVIGLVQVGEAALADRYAYIPLIGIFVMIAWSLDGWAGARRLAMAGRVIPVFCVLGIFIIVTVRQIGFWESEYTLWKHTVVVTERNPHAHIMLGNAIMNANMTPHDLESFSSEQKQLSEAQRQYEEAIESSEQLGRVAGRPVDLAAMINQLGDASRLQNQQDQSRRRHYEEALNNLGVIAARQGNSPRAIALWRAALALVPDYGDALANLGHQLLITGQLREARSTLAKAVALNPDRANSQGELGALLGQMGEYEEARRHLEVAEGLAPSNAQNENNLCYVLTRMGQTGAAKVHCEEAVRLGGNLPGK